MTFLYLIRTFFPTIEAIHHRLKTVKHYIILSDDGEIPETSVQPLYEYEKLIGSAPSVYEYPDLDENTVGLTEQYDGDYRRS